MPQLSGRCAVWRVNFRPVLRPVLEFRVMGADVRDASDWSGGMIALDAGRRSP
jgi:hypothetical protein